MGENQLDKKAFSKEESKFWAPIALSSAVTLIGVGMALVIDELQGGWVSLGGGIVLFAVGQFLHWDERR